MLPGQAGNLQLAVRQGAVASGAGGHSDVGDAFGIDFLTRSVGRLVLRWAGGQTLIAEVFGEGENVGFGYALELRRHDDAASKSTLEILDLLDEVVVGLPRQLWKLGRRTLPLGAMTSAAMLFRDFIDLHRWILD